MFKRLQGIKPSSDVSRGNLSKEHQQNQQYMKMRLTRQPGAAQRGDVL